MNFPMIGKFNSDFSNHWKKRDAIFQCLENPGRAAPEKRLSSRSTPDYYPDRLGTS